MSSEPTSNFDFVFNLYGFFNERKIIALRTESNNVLYQIIKRIAEKNSFAESLIPKCVIKTF